MSNGKKIDITPTVEAQLTSEGSSSDLAYLKANGPRALPNSPTSSGWSAEAVKKQLYRQAEIIFSWLKTLAGAQLDFAHAVDDYLYEVSIGKDWARVFSTIEAAQAELVAGNIAQGSIVLVSSGFDLSAYYCGQSGLSLMGQSLSTFLARISAIEALFASGKAKKALADEDGNNIKETYGKLAGGTSANEQVWPGYNVFYHIPLIYDQTVIKGNLWFNMSSGYYQNGVRPPALGASSLDYFEICIGLHYGAHAAYKLPFGSSNAGNYTIATTLHVDTAKNEAISAAKDYADSKFENDAEFIKDVKVNGDMIIAGDLITQGQNTVVESTTLSIEDVNIELAKGNNTALTQIAGFHVLHYNGIDVGGIGFDASGFAYVGDMIKDNATGVITRGDAQEIATRKDHGQWSQNEIAVWDDNCNCYKPGGNTIANIIADYEAKIASAQSVLYLHDHGDGTLDLVTTAGVSGLSIVSGDDGYLKLVYGN